MGNEAFAHAARREPVHRIGESGRVPPGREHHETMTLLVRTSEL
jgi:hypothetical protein